MNDVNNTCVSYSGGHNLLLGSKGGDNKVSRKQIFHNFLNIIAHHIVEICLPSLASYHPRLPRGAGLFAEEAG